MKKLKWLAACFATLLLSAVFLTSCSSGISQENYDAVVAERNNLQTERNSLQSQVATLQGEKQSIQSELTALTANLTILQNDYDDLQDDYDTIQSTQADLQSQLDEANTELIVLNSVFPPGNFVSETELLVWLDQNTVSELEAATTVQDWINKALQIQSDALLDGYIINMDYDYDAASGLYNVYCTTIINGAIYYWNPETDDITIDTNL